MLLDSLPMPLTLIEITAALMKMSPQPVGNANTDTRLALTRITLTFVPMPTQRKHEDTSNIWAYSNGLET